MSTGFTQVSVNNFKSIRDLKLSPRRVNVFIGEANTGKSNIIEALAVFSEGAYEDAQSFHDLLRFKTTAELFYDRDLSQPAQVEADGCSWSLKLDSRQFSGAYLGPPGKEKSRFIVSPEGQIQINAQPTPRTKFYQFKTLSNFPDPRADSLHAPSGRNLVALLTTNKRLRGLVNDLFRERGFRLIVNPDSGELSMAKEMEDQLYLFSYPTISETFRRIVFYMAILETNQDSILLLDEPETNTFPFYTAYLAERIALSESNQFFLTTHNPYVLGSIVGKTPVKDLAVFVTTMEGFRTVVTRVEDDKLPLIMDYGQDAFMNLDKLVAA